MNDEQGEAWQQFHEEVKLLNSCSLLFPSLTFSNYNNVVDQHVYRLANYKIFFSIHIEPTENIYCEWDNGEFDSVGESLTFEEVLGMVSEEEKIELLYYMDILGRHKCLRL